MSPIKDQWESPDGSVRLILGDCLHCLPLFEENTFDAIVTDPPAGIGFMGVAWDSYGKGGMSRKQHRDGSDEFDFVGSKERPRTADQSARVIRNQGKAFIDFMTAVAFEMLAVLKPGGHALVWALPRTSHWTATALEDAGFEVRDRVSHLFGSGFPKSLDVSKAIDKAARREYVLAAARLGMEIPGNSLHDWTKAEHSPGDKWWAEFKSVLSPEQWGAIEREVVGQRTTGIGTGGGSTPIMGDGNRDITAPATDAARRWLGWHTALKPACEDWWLVRKPLSEPTIAANVLRWGTGAINVDGCRVEAEPELAKNWHRNQSKAAEEGRNAMNGGLMAIDLRSYTPQARWPANVTHDGSDEVVGLFPVTGVSSGGITPRKTEFLQGVKANGDDMRMTGNRGGLGDSGSAARFFYTAKASKDDRGEDNRHPTVKSTELMRWLLRLITPPDGLVLDCFLGSGSTAVAAYNENFRIIGIEQEREYWEIAVRRVRAELERFPLFEQAAKPRQRELIP